MESSTPIWKKVVNVFRDTAISGGKGLQFLFHTGIENRHYFLPVVNGLVGDKLKEVSDKGAIEMRFRRNDEDIDIEDPYFEKELRSSNGKVFLFIHGLMSDEVLFQKYSSSIEGYGSRFSKELGVSVFYIRYNSGLHISENGKNLTDLLNRFYLLYSNKINSIDIFAHSMGGLVTQSSTHYARLNQHAWIQKIRKIFLIGVPNDGSYLEKFGHLTTFLLKNIPNYPTRLVGRIADERSSGIKDLRWGFMVDEDWQEEGSEKFLNVKKTTVPPLEKVKYYLIIGSLIEDQNSLLAEYFGDGLVGMKSAGGTFSNGNEPHPNVSIHTFSETGHIKLLGNDSVYEFLKLEVSSEVSNSE